ncbi:MAG: hypothetical protein Q8P90_03445 [bacterium]|nr:hypothetical protein [bacterium]
MKIIQQLVKFLKQHSTLIFFLLFSLIFLALLNNWIWPTPDEYIYANIVNAFKGAFNGEISWYNINTEHTFLVAFVAFLYNLITNPQTLTEYRIPIFIFAAGFIISLYLLTNHLDIKKERRKWFLFILLLIPGFWIFSVRLMLDIPATFAFTFLVYLLAKKAKAYQIGLGLLLLMLIKDYYLLLAAPMIFTITILDSWKINKEISYKILYIIKESLIIAFPTFIATILLLDFNMLPYPRLYENLLRFVFGDIYIFINKLIFSVLDQILSLSPSDTPLISELSQSKIAIAEYSREIPTGLVESQIQRAPANFFQKLWLIYSYNFSEQDLNIFILPLTSLGIWISAKRIFNNFKKHYSKIRPDIVMMTLLLVFVYLNYHEAESIIGFRVTLPILVCIIYFTFLAARQILTKFSKRQSIIFSSVFIFFVILYWFDIKDLVYGSALANASFLATLLTYKPIIFIALFVILLIGVILFPKIKLKQKYPILGLIIITLLCLKMAPFYFNNKLSLATYGYDYGAPTATDSLKNASNNGLIASNAHFYETQYYSSDIQIRNNHAVALIRTFDTNYQQRYFTIKPNELLTNKLRKNGINYYWILNNSNNQKDLQEFYKVLDKYPLAFTKVDEQRIGNRTQWMLYKFNHKKYRTIYGTKKINTPDS